MKTTPKLQKAAALAAVGQGLLTALLPQVTIRAVKLVLSRNFRNTSELEAHPEYVRQTRAAGIGLAAAGIAAYAMERVADGRTTDDRPTDAAEPDD